MGRLFGPFFVFSGIMHFVKTRLYERIVPPYLPRAREIVYVSGVAEIAGGLATMHPATRRAGSLWSIATLVAVFPANLHMAVEAERFEKAVPGGRTALYLRLPVQLLFIAWAYAAGNWDQRR
jgi:uncharacterized membrane protein